MYSPNKDIYGDHLCINFNYNTPIMEVYDDNSKIIYKDNKIISNVNKNLCIGKLNFVDYRLGFRDCDDGYDQFWEIVPWSF